jgi:hypothetical protein
MRPLQLLFVASYVHMVFQIAKRTSKNKGCVSHCVALPVTLKSILMQKKNYGNSNIYFTMQRYNLQKNPLKETKILQDIRTL